MSNSPGKYGNVREFLDNLGNEKIKICRNCNAVFSYLNENTTLCISCDYEEEISTLPAVVEIEDSFEMVETEPAVVAAQPAVLEAEPIVAEIDIVESTSDWDMDSFDDMGAETVVEEAVEAETVVEAVEAETIQDAIESDKIAETIVEEAIEKEEEAIVKVEDATDNEVEAIEDYSEAVKVEENAAEVVTDAAIVQSEAIEAVVEASEKVSDLVESGADDNEVKDALNELEETVQDKEEAEVKLSKAVEVEEQAAEVLEEKVEEKNIAEEKLESEIEELKEASETLDSAIVQKDESEKELAQTVNTDTIDVDDTFEPFVNGDYVSHGVYGNGEVLSTTKAGKHWSIEVDFDEGKRRILGTFLTKAEKPEQDEENYEAPIENLKEENVKTYDEYSGKYKPGSEVIHKIFGKGFIKESEPKGENYKLIINFEDGSEKTLLSTFIKLADEKEEDEPVVEEAVEAEPVVEAVEAEPVVEAVEAEPVVEAVEAEPVEKSDDAFKRPSKKQETVIDLSKPEIQDAEMIDDED